MQSLTPSKIYHVLICFVMSVGELFLSELGLLGVVCLCHGLRMSVGKFCEVCHNNNNGAFTFSFLNSR